MNPSKVIQGLAEFLTCAEIAGLSGQRGYERPHPVFLLLEREGGSSQHRFNVDAAIKQVSRSNPDWLQKMKRRILGKNLEDASATLAELRAYGALLQAGFTVTAVPTGQTPTPEFTISDGSTTAVVEVHAKQVSATTEDQLTVMRKVIADERPAPGKIVIHEQVVHPWGRAVKVGDSTTLNAISKICAIKGKEHQLQSSKRSIVWMDFQDLYSWDLALTPDQFRPLLSWNEAIGAKPK